MKKQNIINLLAAGALVVALAFGVQSCKKDDPCDGVECVHGECSDGSCICPDGYVGSDCGTEERATFLGTWRTTNETCTSGGPSIFDITITQNSDLLKVNISNVYGAGFTAVASVSGNSLTIASQPFGTGSIVGSGTVNGTSLSLSYTVTGGGGSDNCNNVPFLKL